jgi:hypothetical protein
LVRCDEDVQDEWLRGLVRADGRITLDGSVLNATVDHDGVPGFALLALADFPGVDVGGCLEWYWRRFSAVHPWLLAATQLPAWSALAGRVPGAIDFVAMIADWLSDWQHESSGAFLAELQPLGPSCQTAWLGASMARAAAAMYESGDVERGARYTRSCRAALRFVARLVVGVDDTFSMPNPAAAIGGVRRSLNRSDMPLEAAAHLLDALLRVDSLPD